MKKQELIHLHGLLAEVSNHCEMTEGRSFDFEEYRSMGVRPTSIHQSKTDHKDAVFALAEGITSNIETDEELEVVASAD